MSMPGSGHARLHKRLEALQKRAAAGDQAAAGQADRLGRWIDAETSAANRAADTRLRVLLGAAVLTRIRQGHSVALRTPDDLIKLGEVFDRPADREAIAGSGGRGSAALHRALGTLTD